MSAPPFMPLYVADYLADTTHLTATEHGAYLMLLMCMWRAGGSLPDDDAKLARFAKLTGAQWSRVRPVLMDFFTVENGVFTQRRLARELTRHSDAVRQRREAASNGGKAKSLKDKEPALAPAMLPARQPEPEPKRVDIEAKASRRIASDEPPVWSPTFAEAYALYPDEMKRSKSRAACWPIWKDAASKAGGEGALIGAVRRYRAEDKQHKGESKAPAFDRWLRDGRWEHWLEVRVTAAEPRWTGPPEIRARVAMEQTEAFARSYLDHAEWTPEGIRPANGFAFDKLKHLRSLKDVKLLQPQERAA